VTVHVTLVSGIDPTAPRPGGTRSYVLGLAERLVRRNVSVALVARNGTALPFDGAEYVRIRSGPSSVRFLLRLIASAPSLPIPRGSIIHVQRPDDLVAFALAQRGNPKVCTLHGIPALGVRRRKGPSYGALYRALERIGLRRTDRVIAVDPGTARWYADRYPRLAGRIDVVPVAVDTERFRPTDRGAARARFGIAAKHAVAFAGRLTVEKRVEALIRAIRDVPDVELLVAGEGPEEPRLRTLARNAPVRFLGPIPHEEMPLLLRAADIVALPSEFEGMPTIAIEALACGTPVVATRVGGLPELIVPGETGWLVEDVAAIPQVLRDGLPLAGAMEASCVVAARAYSWDSVVERILAVYRLAEADT
jgi:glycosyltransferase involved in cell wall biosynthesis